MPKFSYLRWLRDMWPDILTGIVLIAAMIVAAVMMLGCAGARITPAKNQVEAVQTSSGPTERTTITIGGQPVPKNKPAP